MKKTFYILALIIGLSGVVLEIYLLKKQNNEASSNTPAAVLDDGSLRSYSTVPPFSFTDRDGKKVARADLQGKVWLADFIYTDCPTTCPMLSRRLADLQAAVLALGSADGKDDVRLVSFSVDPDKDTPDVLDEYAKALGATPRWHFLTGNLVDIQRIARQGFLVGFEKVPGTTRDITHSTKIALVDAKGVVRKFYDGIGENDQRSEILEDIKKLLQEKE